MEEKDVNDLRKDDWVYLEGSFGKVRSLKATGDGTLVFLTSPSNRKGRYYEAHELKGKVSDDKVECLEALYGGCGKP